MNLKDQMNTFKEHLQLQRDVISYITIWPTTNIVSNKNLKLLSKENQDSIKILSHIFDWLYNRVGDNDNALRCNTKNTSNLKRIY